MRALPDHPHTMLLFHQVLANTVNGTTYAGIRARTTGVLHSLIQPHLQHALVKHLISYPLGAPRKRLAESGLSGAAWTALADGEGHPSG